MNPLTSQCPFHSLRCPVRQSNAWLHHLDTPATCCCKMIPCVSCYSIAHSPTLVQLVHILDTNAFEAQKKKLQNRCMYVRTYTCSVCKCTIRMRTICKRKHFTGQTSSKLSKAVSSVRNSMPWLDCHHQYRAVIHTACTYVRT